MLKVAQYAAQLEQYKKAIDIYEEVHVYLLVNHNLSLQCYFQGRNGRCRQFFVEIQRQRLFFQGLFVLFMFGFT